MAPFRIGFLTYPRVTQLDVTGPAQFFALMSDSEQFFVWKTTDPAETDAGFAIVPTATFETCPSLDLICIPGGGGQADIMNDVGVLDWVKRQGLQASYVTSVCGGSLLLGAAGLLTGYKAGAHWAFRKYLPRFGARPIARRVVKDRNRITGGGVTAGTSRSRSSRKFEARKKPRRSNSPSNTIPILRSDLGLQRRAQSKRSRPRTSCSLGCSPNPRSKRSDP